MLQLMIIATLVFVVSLLFSMFGKGGGELYVPILVTLLGLNYYRAASLSLLLITLQGFSMVTIYHRKHKLLDWTLAIVLGIVVGISSFLGGFVSYKIPAVYLKICFSALLIASAIMILSRKEFKGPRIFMIRRKLGDISYEIQLVGMILPVALVAFLAGMAGISGGGLIVPICVILGGVPLRIAMATNSFLALSSSSMSFLGHVIRGEIDPALAIILGFLVILGSQIGSRMHIRIDESTLRRAFSLILLGAAIWMIIGVFV